MIGTVRVRNLQFQGSHGATAAERRSTRRFQVDADIRFEMGRAVENDRLQETINYYDVCALLVEIGESKAHRLLERLAGAMLKAILERWPSSVVEIEVRKLHPPCPGNPDYTAVRLSSG
jgi:7,8-dihydroneopterin aldolase/epimerase/oxygenase